MMNKKKHILLGATVISVVIWTGVFVSANSSSVSPLNTIAQQAIAECAHGDSLAHAACYEKVIPALYPRFTV